MACRPGAPVPLCPPTFGICCFNNDRNVLILTFLHVEPVVRAPGWSRGVGDSHRMVSEYDTAAAPPVGGTGKPRVH